MFRKPMKMRDLEFLGIPSYIVDVWEENYSPYLLLVQEEVRREYGLLDFGEGNMRLTWHFASRNDRGMDSRLRGNDKKDCGNDRAGRMNPTPTFPLWYDYCMATIRKII